MINLAPSMSKTEELSKKNWNDSEPLDKTGS